MLASVSRVAELEYSDDDVFTIVDEMPEFPGGGQAALLQYLAASIRYPRSARENGIQGRVVCNFIINKDGKVQDTEVIRSVSPDLDREALRVINAMPPWTPGKQKGKAVRVRYCIPIVFRLQ